MKKTIQTLALIITSNIIIAQTPTFTANIVKDINASGSSGISSFTQIGNFAVFSANDGVNGNEPWVTDGTAIGTKLLLDINPSSTSGTPNSSGSSNYNVFNSSIIFTANNNIGSGLWKTDGTPSGTTLLKQFPLAAVLGEFKLYNGKFYFQADDGIHGSELWVTDGTAIGTNLVKDIYIGSNSSYPAYFCAHTDGFMYFMASDTLYNFELWRTDGTLAGTTLVKDILPGVNGSYPTNMFSYNGSVYFAGYDVTNLQQLWVSDGTSSGTQLFKVLNSTANSFPTVFNIINNKMIFLAENQPSNSELWVSDGTASGTTLLSDINSNPNLSSNPQNFYAIGNKMYFSADDGVHGNELWVTDGTTLGTNLKFDINVGVNSSNPNALFYDGTQLFMGADSLINDLMVTDLVITPKTYCKVNNGISSSPSEIFKINSKLFVVATGAYGNEIYSIDTVNTVGINEISKNIQLNVYPNPTNSFINIDKALIGHDYVLTNYIGEIILSGEVKETINLEELISGVYYLKIEGGIAKIIKY